jgi:voltage-gated potassium channel
MPDRDSRSRVGTFAIPVHGELAAFLRRLVFLVVAILVLLAAGTAGFVATEGISVWEGFVWSLDTIATIGSIPNPPGTGGQIVKIVLIVLGVGTLLYALVTATEFFVAGHLTGLLDERRTLRTIKDYRDHHLICGFGRVGRQVARDLKATRDPYVVVDALPENRDLAEAMGADFLLGTPSDDEMLREAGIERARSVLACVDSDAENIFICLTARELRDDITIVARASVEDSEKKLLRAGANRVISPYKASGAEMARLALQPQVAGVVDVAPEYRMEEIEVTDGCEGVGKRISEIRGTVTIAAIRRGDGRVDPQPAGSTELRAGDVLVAMGTVESLRRLEELFAPVAAKR